jgi:hypothetical protein
MKSLVRYISRTSKAPQWRREIVDDSVVRETSTIAAGAEQTWSASSYYMH